MATALDIKYSTISSPSSSLTLSSPSPGWPSAATSSGDLVTTEDGREVVSLAPEDLEAFLRAQNVMHVLLLWPTLLYLALLMAGGLVGNTLVLLVYWRRFKPSATRTFILAISGVDMATSLFSLPADLLEVRYHNTFRAGWACKLARSVKSWLGFMSACLLVAVALDRYRTVCRSRAPRLTTRQFIIVFSLCCVISLVLTSPYTVLTGCHTLTYPDTNVTGVMCSIEDRYVGSLFLVLYDVFTGLAFVACVVIMLVCYARIARELWRHRQRSAATVTCTGMALHSLMGSQGALRETRTYVDEETSADRTEQNLDSSVVPSRVYGCDHSTPNNLDSNDSASAARSSKERETISSFPDNDSLATFGSAGFFQPGRKGSAPSASVRTLVSADGVLTNGEAESFTPAERLTDAVGKASGLSLALADEDPSSVDIICLGTTSGAEDVVQTVEGSEDAEALLDADVQRKVPNPNIRIVIQQFSQQEPHDVCRYDSIQPEFLTTAERASDLNESTKHSSKSSSSLSSSSTAARTAAATTDTRADNNNLADDATRSAPSLNSSFSTSKKLSTSGSWAGKLKKESEGFPGNSLTSLPSQIKHNLTRRTRKSSTKLVKGSVRKIPMRTTLMMFVLTAVFVVNYLPYLTVVSLRVALGLGRLVAALGLNGYHVLIRSYFINSAVNALVYGFCSQRFRRECRLLFQSSRRSCASRLQQVVS